MLKIRSKEVALMITNTAQKARRNQAQLQYLFDTENITVQLPFLSIYPYIIPTICKLTLGLTCKSVILSVL